jgi:sugar phosphate isomerase/epimerase
MWKLTAYAHKLQSLQDLKKMGFDCVASNPMLLGHIGMGILPSDDVVQAVKRGLQENALELVTLVILTGWDALGLSGMMELAPAAPADPEYEEVRKRGVQEFIKLVKICKALGCIQISSMLGGRPLYHYDHEEAWKKSIRDLAPVLREEGVRLAFQPHMGDFIEESDPFVDLLVETKCREVGYTYVVPHTYVLAGRYDADASAMIEYAHNAGVLMEVHMADTLRPLQMWVQQHREILPIHSHLIPGEGNLDIKSIVRTLDRINFDGPVVLIPYRFGRYPKSFSDLNREAKQAIEKMLQEVRSGRI